jgi:hypothetical protein
MDRLDRGGARTGDGVARERRGELGSGPGGSRRSPVRDALRFLPWVGRTRRRSRPVATALRTAPADLTHIANRRGGEFPDGEIARYIDGRFDVSAHGAREMPVWGERFAELLPGPGIGEEAARGKIAVLLEYLKSIQRK